MGRQVDNGLAVRKSRHDRESRTGELLADYSLMVSTVLSAA